MIQKMEAREYYPGPADRVGAVPKSDFHGSQLPPTSTAVDRKYNNQVAIEKEREWAALPAVFTSTLFGAITTAMR